MSTESFGKYLLLERLAAGGMAEVYLAKSTGANGINKFVAIKRILPQYSDNPEFVDMFKEEAKIAVNLNHSNIVSIYDFGIEKSQFFLVMEFVEGQNLRQILNHMKKEGKELTTDQIVYLIKEVAAGLDHAHRCLDGATGRPLNITHRDMSPQNVMISFEGEIKVVDFGIAKAETQMENTRAGTIKGKFGYMSPEQAEGQVVDPRTDIFSLGIVLWELLAKDRLFTAQNEAATLRKVRECQIPSLKKINPSIQPELERIAMKALAKDKSVRYQTAASFHKDLNRFLNTQYPDFSTQEFSKYMKSLYHKMYLENRKKLADYAAMSQASSFSEDKTAVTTTVTETDRNIAEPQPKLTTPSESEGLQLNSNSARVELNQLKSGEPAKSKLNTNSGFTRGPQHKARGGTQSRIYTPVQSNSQFSSQLVMLFIVGALAGAGFLYWKKASPQMAQLPNSEHSLTQKPEQKNQEIDGHTESSSKQAIPINIQSSPQGAVVYINGVNTGITPYISHLESGKEFHLTLKKEGYLVYDRPSEIATGQIYRLEATLQPEPPMGYVAIEIIGQTGVDPVLTVNGQRVADRSQWSRYPVQAGVPVKIRASNPFAQLAAEETVTVGASQKKSVRLILTRTSGNE